MPWQRLIAELNIIRNVFLGQTIGQSLLYPPADSLLFTGLPLIMAGSSSAPALVHVAVPTLALDPALTPGPHGLI